MAIVNVFINKALNQISTKMVRLVQSQNSTTQVVIPIDAITSESFDFTSDITSHPVETDTDISDHVILKPRTLSLEGVVSETPLFLNQSLLAVGAAAAGQLGDKAIGSLGRVAGSAAGGLAGKSVAGLLGIADYSNRLTDAIDELTKARNEKTPIIIQTGLRRYPSDDETSFYFLQSCSIKRRQGTGRAIEVSLKFIEVVKVQSESVTVTFPKEIDASKKQNVGRQSAAPQTPEKEARSSLFLKTLRFGGLTS